MITLLILKKYLNSVIFLKKTEGLFMNKILITLSATLLSGCIYQQSPAPVNTVELVDPTPVAAPVDPVSISYPLPSQPQTVISDTPYAIPNSELQPVESPTANEDISSNNVVNGSNQGSIEINIPEQKNNDINSMSAKAEEAVNSIIDEKPAPVKSEYGTSLQQDKSAGKIGTFNNPVQYVQP